ncbi:hypothetical protein Lesp02_70420 [Lentzea sp. NBRC 105346]|uniref:hypothetical protein n=1 Tax=Lentzea sp. NBRC 105346 TaxID=3032205 RepID=UPI0024A21865|nr:hypothetical protein [Lentzea sp. NBRC 105346]GLZ34855.1 hypothetical protein Lesp02_70420 [Lentzea sp. NBRC 105346]
MQTSTSRPTSGEPSSYSLAILLGLGAKNADPLRPGHVYEGTADPARVAKRRAKNRVARASRRINRKRAAR